MSRKSWRRKFQPILNKEKLMDKTALELVEMSIKKYQGMLSENLLKHDLKVEGYQVEDENGNIVIGIHGGDCPLCVVYVSIDDRPFCYSCPLDLSDNNCRVRRSSWKRLIDEEICDSSVNAMIEGLENSKKYIKT